MKDRELLILLVLEVAKEPLPGVAFADLIGGWRRSSAYLSLAYLQAEGMIHATWVTIDGRRTRVFTISTMGQAALGGWRKQIASNY